MLNTKKYGTGSNLVVLVHGGPSIYGYMSSLGEQLAEDCTILDYAQRGTVEAPSDQTVSIDSHVRVLENIINAEKANYKDIYVIGHSWGANIALFYAAKNPKTLTKVICIGTAPLAEYIADEFSKNLSSRLTASEINRMDNNNRKYEEVSDLEEKTKLKLENLNLLTPVYNFAKESIKDLPTISWNYQTYCECADSIWDYIDAGKIKNVLGSIKIPVIAFHGEYDPIPYTHTIEMLEDHIKDLEVHTYKDAGHFIWVDPAGKDQFMNDLNRCFL